LEKMMSERREVLYDCAFCGIEGADSRFCEDCVAVMFAPVHEIERLRSSLEDSQSESERLRAEVVLLKQGQIDKAWRLAVQDETLGTTGAFAILRKLGIVACEECGGSGWIGANEAGDTKDCPSCHGHGWVVK